MKLCLASISWAQFAGSSRRSATRAGGPGADPSSPEACPVTTRGRPRNGGDVTPGRSFGFRVQRIRQHSRRRTPAHRRPPGRVGSGRHGGVRGYAQQFRRSAPRCELGHRAGHCPGSRCSAAAADVRGRRDCRPRGRMSSASPASQRRWSGFCRIWTARNGAGLWLGALRGQFRQRCSDWLTLYQTGAAGSAGRHRSRSRRTWARLRISHHVDERRKRAAGRRSSYKLLFCTDPSVWA